MEPKFKIGDRVVYTNGYGINCGERTITDVKVISYGQSGWGYLITPTDTPWFAIKEENLRAVKKDEPVVACSSGAIGWPRAGVDSEIILTPYGADPSSFKTDGFPLGIGTATPDDCERSCHGTGTVEYRATTVLTVSQERRLRVATQILAGIVANSQYYSLDYDNGDEFVRQSLLFADRLIAEAAKG